MHTHNHEHHEVEMLGSLAFNIREWIQHYNARPDGRFSTKQLDRALGLKTERQKNNRKGILQRLVKEGLITRVAYGLYRRASNNCQPVDWHSA